MSIDNLEISVCGGWPPGQSMIKCRLRRNIQLMNLKMTQLTCILILVLHVIHGSSKECSKDFDCPSIQTCLSGTCHEEYDPEKCRKRSDCLRSQYGYECVKGKCGCTSTNQDCPAGNFCTKKRCLLTGKFCNTNKECKGSNKGHRCEDGQCVCYSSRDCNINYNCMEKVCKVDKTKMKDTMKEQMERMGNPAYQQEGMMDPNMGHDGMYGMDGNTGDHMGREEF